MVKKFILITLLILSFPLLSNAEDFTEASRFQWWIYENTNTQIASGSGLISNTYQNANRIQWLYNNYTYDQNYLYDISFRIEMFHFPAQDLTDLAQSCEIYPNSGPHYTCYVGKEYVNNTAYLIISAYNIQGNSQSNLWMNVYWSNNTTLNLDINKYTLTINRKTNTNVSSQDIANQTQTIINNQNTNTQNIINSQNDINNSINDSSIPTNSEISSKFGDFDDFLPSNNTISSLITMPLTLFQSVLNSINGTCQPFSLGSLLGTNLTLPCITLSNYLGTSLWSIIDILFSGLFIFTISKKFIKVFENFSTLKEGDVIGD